MTGTPQRHDAGSYAAVNGINLYYEIPGADRPLVLHGAKDAGAVTSKSLDRCHAQTARERSTSH